MMRRKSSAAPKDGSKTPIVSFSRRRARRARARHKRDTPLAYLGLAVVALAILLGLFWVGDPTPDPIQSIEGNVTHVRDGDTIEIGPRVIRLAALDCAEMDSAEGRRAGLEMRRLVQGKRLACTDLGPDRYGRTLGQCAIIDDPLTLSEHMVNGGFCSYWGIRP